MSRDKPQFVRLAERDRPPVAFFIDGRPAAGLRGDTLLSALMLNGYHLRQSEFGDGPRAGFCNMAACQDCWVDLEDGERVRACSTVLHAGIRVLLDRRA